MSKQFNIEDFLAFEIKYKLFTRKYKNLHYWAYIRFILYYEIYREKHSIGPNQSSIFNYTKLQKIFIVIKNIGWALIRNPFLYKGKRELLIFNQQRRVMLGREYVDPLFDTWVKQEKSFSYVMLEDNHLGTHFPVSDKNNLLYLDYFILLRKIVRSFLRVNTTNLANEICDLIESEFYVKINKKQLSFKLDSLYVENQYLRALYKKLLVRYMPRALLINCYYNFTKMIFIELAHEMKIPVIEFQHGSMGKEHLAYNYPEDIRINSFPDYIFVWAKFWKDITRFPIEKDKVIVTGYPFFEQRIIDEKEKLNKKTNIKPVILFISQGTIGKDLSKIAVELFSMEKENYDIIYKLHPGEYHQWRKKYPWLVSSGIKVIDNSNKDIYQFFSEIDIQIGVYSTALFEGLGFDLLTIIVQLPFSSLMEDAYQQGYVLKAKDCFDIVEILKSQQRKKKFTENKFWEPDSVNKITESLHVILNNQNDNQS
ncbi:MAG: hypothetical protein RAO94_02145 [Candidatus Stygibacter australis]|nr:hypothetical protein [Candidatus Stygibacter australis]MDP8321132.1 hypothetical protein [Candidatus Stygibacter australis]